MMEDTTQMLARGDASRDSALDQFKSLGADVVKIRVEWGDIAPDPAARRKPDFDPSDPDAYPAGAWEALDGAVRGVVTRGMRPFLMVGPPAPEWATGGTTRKYRSVYKPDPAEFARFMTAVGRRYGGGFQGLPNVTMWSIWNEPNHPQFIQPLSERLGGTTVASSPHQYRRLYVAARDALGSTGHDADTILFGEILPIGQSRLGALNTIRPLLWIREFFCVDAKWKPFRGAAASARGCDPFPQIRTSGFAYHPYVRPVGVRFKVPSVDDATIGQIGRVENAFDRIARTRRVKRGLPIYSSEFGVQTDPPDCVGFGAPIDKQGAILNEAEFISYTHRRVKTYSQYLLIDDPILPQEAPGTNERYGRFQTGLQFGDNAVKCESPAFHFAFGSPKPGFDAYRTPIWVQTQGVRGVTVFGRARPRGKEPQQIEILRGGRVIQSVTATGYFLARVNGTAKGNWQLRWSFGGVTYRSRLAKAVAPFPSKYR
jgi:hypothetical protein